MPSRLYILFHQITVYVITESLKTAKQTKRVLFKRELIITNTDRVIFAITVGLISLVYSVFNVNSNE